MKKRIIVIVGPTAVGKTSLSISLARRLDGEIISGDSMQVYRGMDIGTAKIRPEEMEGIPHHLIDIRNPDETYSAAEFKRDVNEKVTEITEKNRIPILVGGSGLYIQAALYDYNFSDIPRDEKWTEKLMKEAREDGIDRIYRKLKEVDPEQAEKIHPNNHRRIIRALEIYEATGKTKTEWEKEQKRESPYDPLIIGLTMEREKLYEQINRRVDQMMENGLLEEVETLYRQGFENTQAMKAIGYKEFIPYLEGEIMLEDAIETLKRNSRRFAKRQYTWFRNKLPVTWYLINPEEKDEKFLQIINNVAGILNLE